MIKRMEKMRKEMIGDVSTLIPKSTLFGIDKRHYGKVLKRRKKDKREEESNTYYYRKQI